LKPGTTSAAEELLSAGPPFDPGDAGLSAHAAYLDGDRVYLVFEGDGARKRALELGDQHADEVTRWQELVWELPTVVDDVPPTARCLYRWPAGS
jgi:hypothetical protein